MKKIDLIAELIRNSVSINDDTILIINELIYLKFNFNILNKITVVSILDIHLKPLLYIERDKRIDIYNRLFLILSLIPNSIILFNNTMEEEYFNIYINTLYNKINN